MVRRHFAHHLMQLGVIGAVVYSSSCLAAKTKQDELPGQSRPVAAAASQPAANAPLTREAATAQLQAQFQALDTNKDGALSQAEIAAGVSARRAQVIATVRKQREAAFAAMDTNKDGQLSREEFMAGGPKFTGPAPDGSKALRRFDTNKDGKVTMSEYLTVALAAFDRANASRTSGPRTNVNRAPADNTKKTTQP
jgi:Ca2+-binding EF-hand superfamily protein